MAAPTPAEIRAVLEGYGINGADPSDAWITLMRDEEIVPHIEDVTRSKFTEITEVTEYYNGTGLKVLILNRRPIVEVTAIAYVNDLAEGNLLNSVELISSEGILRSKSRLNEGVYGPIFKRGAKNIKVTYTYGFDDFPTDIARAVKNMVAAKILTLIGARTGGGSLSVQAHGRSYGSHGKYTEIRKELVHGAYALLKKYTTGISGA